MMLKEKLNVKNAEPMAFRGKFFSARKKFVDGTHRCRSPQETYDIIKPYFKEIGLTRLADITGLDRIGIPVTLAIRPNAKMLAVDSGKGFNLTAALVSAAMESLERYHGDFSIPEFVEAPYIELASRHKVVAEEHLLLTKHAIFSPRLPERWAFGWDLMGGEEVAVPLELVMGPYCLTEPTLGSFYSSTSGLASGNQFLEAVCAGLYELIERDAIACHQLAWGMPGYPRRRIDKQSFDFPMVRELFEKLDRAGVGVELYDFTHDTGVPAFEAVLYDQWVPGFGNCGGNGCHLDPQIAMVRAITEAVQSRGVWIAGSRDDMYDFGYRAQKLIDVNGLASMKLDRDKVLPLAAVESGATEFFEEDLRILLKRIRDIGLDQVIVFDLTLPGYQVSIVRVFVPGLEPSPSGRYHPGRRGREFMESHR